MVITPVLQKGIDIKLPETQTAGRRRRRPIDTRHRPDHGKRSDNKNKPGPRRIESAGKHAARHVPDPPDKTIFIRADETLPYQDVLRIIDIAKGAGIEVLGVIPERYTTGK